MENKTTNNTEPANVQLADVICCGTFEKYAKSFNWMFRYDDNKNKIFLMPHIGKEMYRVNNCPTCGAEIRSVELTSEQFSRCR
jgi:hypothetical protein